MNLIKKILIVLFMFVWIFSFTSVFWDGCNQNLDSVSVWQALDNCLEWTPLVGWNNASIDSWGLSVKIKALVDNIGIYLFIFAVWSIVYGALMMTLSSWDDEKIKKAKDIVKWWIIWFIGLISAGAIINLVVKIMYSI